MTKTVRPLAPPPRPRAKAGAAANAATAQKADEATRDLLAATPVPATETRTTSPPAAPPVKPAKPAIPSLHPIGRRERQKIQKGATGIDGRLDLHGFTQEAAHGRLLGFLAHAQSQGARLVLVITGKGRGGGGFEGLHQPERGVLKRVVPLWLALPEFRVYVHGFEDAHLSHGGEGALYIRLRKRKG